MTAQVTNWKLITSCVIIAQNKSLSERFFANPNHHSRWNKIQIGFSESTRSTEYKTDLQDVSYSACFNVNDFFIWNSP